MSTLWVADVHGFMGLGAAETLPPGDSMTLLGRQDDGDDDVSNYDDGDDHHHDERRCLLEIL